MGSQKEEGRSLKSEKEGPSFRFEGNDGAALGDDGVLDRRWKSCSMQNHKAACP